MEKSRLYDSLDDKLLCKWREQIVEEEGETCFFTNEKPALENIKEKLCLSDHELLTRYRIALENKFDYLYYNINIKILNFIKIFNFAIKIGMELESAFIENDAE